jgi:zinc transporter ZupT
VAGELFPIMINSSHKDSFIGISVGFFIGLSTIYGIESIVGYLENIDDDEASSSVHITVSPFVKSFPKDLEAATDSAESSNSGTKPPRYVKDIEASAVYEEEDIIRASEAISNPNHKQHIVVHLRELLENILMMEEKSNTLSRDELTVRQTEEIAEYIDENIHMLQYKLDHCRRLLEGSESHISDGMEKSRWVTEDRKEHIRTSLGGLKLTVEHLLEHINEQILDKNTVHEMRIHMDQMGKQINHFHDNIQTAVSKWTRKHMIETKEGDKLPMGLVLPVTMDCFVDGFLIGISTSINFKAGIILGFANCLEMGFLGMAYASRLVKCTGSAAWARFLALYGPPLVMFLSAGLGGAVGDIFRSIPSVFIGMVAFGTVALVFLVCNELLIEAHEAQGEEERWWISIQVFVGIYLVLMLSHII